MYLDNVGRIFREISVRSTTLQGLTSHWTIFTDIILEDSNVLRTEPSNCHLTERTANEQRGLSSMSNSEQTGAVAIMRYARDQLQVTACDVASE